MCLTLTLPPLPGSLFLLELHSWMWVCIISSLYIPAATVEKQKLSFFFTAAKILVQCEHMAGGRGPRMSHQGRKLGKNGQGFSHYFQLCPKGEEKQGSRDIKQTQSPKARISAGGMPGRQPAWMQRSTSPGHLRPEGRVTTLYQLLRVWKSLLHTGPGGSSDLQDGFLIKLRGKAALAWVETKNIHKL